MCTTDMLYHNISSLVLSYTAVLVSKFCFTTVAGKVSQMHL